MADVIGHETGLGYVAYDTEKVVKTAARCTCPQEILRAMIAELTYIGQLELLAILLVYTGRNLSVSPVEMLSISWITQVRSIA
jgi:hypothetical protein